MNRLLIISTFLLLTSNFLFGQDIDSLVADIRMKYSETRTNILHFNSKMIKTWDESTEGGLAVGSYDSSELKLIEVLWLGETGKKLIEYYFYDGQLIFALEQDFDYNRPIYWDKETAKENGDSKVFDPKKATIKEDRYYFNNEKLFLWLDNEKKAQDLITSKNSIVGRRLVDHCYKMKNELKK